MTMATKGKGRTETGRGGSVADFVLRRLSEWGVERVFGYPGDGINGFLGAFDRAEGQPELIQARHEEMCAFMATGHAKFTGDIGVCMATSGPGAIHLLNGLYDAKLDHQPVVAIVGQQRRMSIGTSYQQEVDLGTLFKDVSEYVTTVMHPGAARHAIDRAVRAALTSRGVATVIFPEDVQECDAMPSPPREHGAVFSSIGYVAPQIIPPQQQLVRAAAILNEGKKVAMLVGQGAARAEEEVLEMAELLGCGIAKALLARAHPPDELPYVTGSIGLLGTKASHEMVMGCDVLFMIGTSFPYSEWLPEEGTAKCVEIDIDGRFIANRYPVDVPLIGDARDTLRALLPLIERKQDRSWRDKIKENVREWWSVVEQRAHVDGDPMNPQRVVWELSSRLPDRAILTADSGSSTNWWARHLKLRKGMEASLSGTLATMGPATPYAIAARLAHPDRPVIAMVGDGAFQMNGMNELITIMRYRERLMASGAPFVFCIFNNEDLNQVTWEQRAMTGDPRFDGSQQLPNFPCARFAELVGMKGLYCDNGDEVGAAWDEALASTDRAVLLEVKVDREIPPLPPDITMDQALAMSSAVAADDPERWGILLKSLKGKAIEFKEAMRPGRHEG